MPSDSNDNDFHFRHPAVADGAEIWRLIEAVGTLDQNSSYLYLLLCRDFADTCLVADNLAQASDADPALAGFVTGYIPPQKPDTLFIWQIGVAPAARGKGLARRLLLQLLQSPNCAGVHYLDTTVTASNTASRALFQGVARRLNADIQELPCFTAELFPDGNHEAEPLLHIGPFTIDTLGPNPGC